MMNRSLKGHIRQVMLAGALGGFAMGSHAGDFYLTDNQITLGGDTYTVGTGGAVDPISITGVSNVSDLPGFNFTINGTDTVVEYDIRLGVIIDDPATNRRVEARIGRVVVTGDGADGIASIAPYDKPESILLFARDGSSVTYSAERDNADVGVISISGTTVTFNAGNLLANQNHSLLSDILSNLANEGTYDYTILMSLVTGPGGGAQFGTVNDGFTPFDDSFAAGGFELSVGGAGLSGDFASPFTMTGQLTISEAPADPDSGDDGDEEETDDSGAGQATDELTDAADGLDDIEDSDDPVDEETVTRVSDALTKASTTAQTVSSAVSSGASGLDVALRATESINKIINTTGTVKSRGGQVDARTANNAVRDVGNIISAVAGRASELTGEQRVQVTTLTKSTVGASSRLVDDNSNADDAGDLADAVSSVVENATRAGVEMDDELIDQITEVSKRSARATARNLLGDDVDLDDEGGVRARLDANPEARERLIDNSVRIPNTAPPRNPDDIANNRNVGPDLAFKLTLALGTVQRPSASGSSIRNAFIAVQNALGVGPTSIAPIQGNIQALEDGELGIVENEENGTVTITLANEKYVGAVTRTRAVSSLVSEGVSFRRNGGAILVANGLAVDISPVAADLTGFLIEVDELGFDATVRDTGAISIDLGNGERFSGVFDYSNLTGLDTENCGDVSISEPDGSNLSSAHVFGVHCENGISQNVVPYPDNPAFYTAMANFGYQVSTDRDTGRISIAQEGNFRPSYYVRPLSSADQALLDAEGADDGIAFRALDINNNGRIDYQVISETGVQVFYSVP